MECCDKSEIELGVVFWNHLHVAHVIIFTRFTCTVLKSVEACVCKKVCLDIKLASPRQVVPTLQRLHTATLVFNKIIGASKVGQYC